MYTLSQPQKILVGCSFVIFFLGIALITYLASTSTTNDTQNEVQSQAQKDTEVELDSTSSSSVVASSISSSVTSSLPTNDSSSLTVNSTSSIVSSINDSSSSSDSSPSASSENTTTSSSSSQTEFQSNLLERINNARANELLEPLAWNKSLTEVATTHSIYISEEEYLTHENESGQSYQERCLAAGANCQHELLNYSDISTAKAVFEQLGSVEDKEKIILDEQLTEIGIGHTQEYTVLVLN